jgi:hypothetical protein
MSAWRSYGSSSGGKPRAVHVGGIGLMELAKMMYGAEKDEVGDGGRAV